MAASDHVVVPLSPDLYSIQGLRNLGPTLRSWREEWAERRPRSRTPGLWLPAGRVALAVDEPTARRAEDDTNCLGLVKHLHSLIPMAQEARKPLFRLKSADGAIGAHQQAVASAHSFFDALTRRVLDRVGISTDAPVTR